MFESTLETKNGLSSEMQSRRFYQDAKSIVWVVTTGERGSTTFVI